MDKNNILSILNDWNFWKKELPSGIKRTAYVDRLHAALATRQIIVITGPRRAGKSFVMRQFAQELTAQGTPKENILMINFEDPRFDELNAATLQQIYETYVEYLAPKGMPYVFLDEVQEVEGWEKWVRTFHELGKAHLVISGSNAKLLSRELSTLLTGRHIDVTVLPLSFSEFLAFNGIIIGDRVDENARKIDIARALTASLEFGAYPQVVLTDDKQPMLLNYYDDLITKDLIRRFKIRKPEHLKALARFYLSNTASPITFNSMANFLKLSVDTVDKFSGYLEDAYLIFLVKRFSFKVKEQEKSPRKVYAIDTGLANVVGFRSSPNTGKLAENLVFIELMRQCAEHAAQELFYWKDERHREVDFVIKEGLRVTRLIQVCWDIAAPKTKDREIAALNRAMDELHLTEGVIVTNDYAAVETHDDTTIRFVPLAEWLLAERR